MPMIKTAYIQANDIGEQLITPKGVIVRVDEALVARLKTLRTLCGAHELEAASVRHSPDAWLPAGVEEELRMNAPKLVVTREVFWFEDQPKNARDHVECIPVHIDGLLAWFANDDDALIVSDDDEFDDYVKGVVTGTASRPFEKSVEEIAEVTSILSSTDLMRRALANFAAMGDVFSDGPECVGSVAAAQNLQVLAALLGGDTETVSKGKLLAGPSKVSDVDIRADGSLVVSLPEGFDPTGHAWNVVTPTGALYRVRHFAGGEGEPGSWLVEEAESFYGDLLKAE